MKVKKLFYLFISSFIAITCAKDKVEKPCVECQSISEAKEFFGFKEGSWWVYEEESSGLRDSCYVTNSSFESNGYDFDVEIYSSHRDYYYRFWSKYYSGNGCSNNEPVSKHCLFVKEAKFKPGDFVHEDDCFFVKYSKDDFIYNSSIVGVCEGSKTIVINIFQSYSVGDLTFNETIKVENECSLFEDIQKTNNFYSKGAGIVKFELIDSNRVWNLINYHIEP